MRPERAWDSTVRERERVIMAVADVLAPRAHVGKLERSHPCPAAFELPATASRTSAVLALSSGRSGRATPDHRRSRWALAAARRRGRDRMTEACPCGHTIC